MNAQTISPSPWISVLGDSISTLQGYSQPEDAVFYDPPHQALADVFAPADTWWGQVIEGLGGRLLVNNAISGSMVTRHRLCETPSYGCSDERIAALGRDGLLPDVILIFLGTNDWGYGMTPIPRHDGETEDLSIFSVAYCRMLEKLRARYPEALLCCFTLPISTCRAYPSFCFPYAYGGYPIEAYNEVIREAAAHPGCCVIDWYQSGLPHDTLDGFHPNADGMKTLAETALSALRSQFP